MIYYFTIWVGVVVCISQTNEKKYRALPTHRHTHTHTIDLIQFPDIFFRLLYDFFYNKRSSMDFI